MNTSKPKTVGLTGNQLKLLAMLAMTCDHVGLQLFPHVPLLRILGRLALPVYAFMIAEGCRYTHDRRKYLARLASLAMLCQIVYFFAMGSLYMCILVTFSLSVALIWAWESGKPWVGPAATAAVFVICVVLPDWIPGFQVDYGLPGVLLPVLLYFGKPRWLFLCLGLALLALSAGGIQWWAFAAVPLLMLYNGQRGKYRMGRLFYLYYPVHLVILYLIGLLFF